MSALVENFDFKLVLDAHRRREERRNPPPKMLCGSYFIPKPNRYNHKPLGEDGYFVCEAERAIGVADGVGGWAASGIDSGVYARQLMRGSAAAARSAAKIDPKAVLASGYASATARGSSTACVAALDGHLLRVANVGDSGLWVFRSSRCEFVSPVQQSRFNCPYQLGRSEGSDRPSDAEEVEFAVRVGDVIVLGTDGLLDNVYPSEVEKLLESEGAELDAEQLAERIAEMALENSRNLEFRSPFQMNAEKCGCGGFVGGKIDDITVIVALIH